MNIAQIYLLKESPKLMSMQYIHKIYQNGRRVNICFCFSEKKIEVYFIKLNKYLKQNQIRKIFLINIIDIVAFFY